MTGSSRSSSSTDLVTVGRVGPAHGLDGAVYVRPDSDDPARFSPGSRLFVGGSEMEVERIRRRPERLLVKFAGISDRPGAERLRGLDVQIRESQRRRLGADEFWPDQLAGLDVRDPSGSLLGRVTGVVWAGAQHRLVIRTDAGVREVPFVRELVPSVNPEDGYLTVMPIPGLL